MLHKRTNPQRKPRRSRKPHEAGKRTGLTAPLVPAMMIIGITTIRNGIMPEERILGTILPTHLRREGNSAGEKEDPVEEREDEGEEGRANFGDDEGGQDVEEEREETEDGGEHGEVDAHGGAVECLLLDDGAREPHVDDHEEEGKDREDPLREAGTVHNGGG